MTCSPTWAGKPRTGRNRGREWCGDLGLKGGGAGAWVMGSTVGAGVGLKRWNSAAGPPILPAPSLVAKDPPMLDKLKPGQTIRCTITAAPRTEAGIDTIERLMRQEPGIKRGLRRAQRRRRQDMIVYNRGNRDWYKRETCGRLVKAAKGAS